MATQRERLMSAVSGGVSGSGCAYLLQPLDVVRTRLQTDALRTGAGAGASAAAARAVAAEGGGLASLWRGAGAGALRVGGGAAIHFYTIEGMRAARRLRGDALPTTGVGAVAVDALIGGSSRALSVSVMCPVTVVKTRMEASGADASRFAHLQRRGVAHALVDIASTEGVWALWRGCWAAIAANAPFSAIHYALYTQLRGTLAERFGESTATTFASGAVASVGATVATQPFDVMRTRSMLRLDDVGLAGGGSGGAASLLVGAAPRFAKRTLQTALVWTIYEELLPRLKALGA